MRSTLHVTSFYSFYLIFPISVLVLYSLSVLPLSCFPYFVFICIAFQSIITLHPTEVIFIPCLDFFLISTSFDFILHIVAVNFYFIIKSGYFIL